MMTEPYQERIAVRSMQPRHVEQVVRFARARQVRAMRQAEKAMDERGTDEINPSLLPEPLQAR